MRPGPEYRLLRGALKTEYFFRRKLPAVFFHEPDLPTGLPDMVAVYLSRDASTITERRRRLTPAHVRLLHGLHSLTSSTPEELRRTPENRAEGTIAVDGRFNEIPANHGS